MISRSWAHTPPFTCLICSDHNTTQLPSGTPSDVTWLHLTHTRRQRRTRLRENAIKLA